MKSFYVFLMLCICANICAQNQIFQDISSAKEQGRSFESQKLLPYLTSDLNAEKINRTVLEKGAVLQLDKSVVNSLLNSRSSSIQLPIQISEKSSLNLELIEHNIFAPDFELYASDERNKPVNFTKGRFFKGVIQGDPNSVVAISVFGSEIKGIISNNDGNYVLGKLKNSPDNKHIVYLDKNLKIKPNFSCGTPDDNIPYKPKELNYQREDTKATGDCIRVYVEVDKDIHDDKGSVTAAGNYVSGLFNEVITLYANDGIIMVVSEILVWNTTSPYSSNSSDGMLSDFQNNISSINGDLGHLLSYQASGGIAAGFSGICANNVDNSLCFSSIEGTYSAVPTYSWSVMVVTHEMGHLIGSRHTHACVWNGNNTAIDGCSGQVEGNCSLPGNPSGGGTIMSYCHITNVGINLNNGFGLQPGNVVRSTIDNSTCTSTCGPPTCTDNIQNGNETGVDCGGPDCPACPTCFDNSQNGNETGVDCGGPDCPACPCTSGDNITVTINFDNYPEETSWNITNASGSTVASGGTYGSAPDGSQFTETICLGEGCYDFTINDAYGDGICCGFGNGSYIVTNSSGTTVASGGSFNSSEITNFCIGGSTGPTCSDGEQNGNETGVDCGGPDCPACPVICDIANGLNAAPSTTEASLTWNNANGAVDYNIRARQTGTSTWTEGVNLTSPVDYTALTNCTEYEFQVQSNCSGATSDWSSSYTFTTTGCGGGCTYVTIDSENFNSSWGIWNDGGSDCRRSANDAAYASGGTGRPVRLRDNTSTSTTTTDILDLSSFEEITVDFTCYPRSMENNEDFWLQVSTNGGSSYTTVASWAAGSDFSNNSRFNESVVITGTFTSNSRIRFRNDASGNSDWVYLDDIVISGCSSSTAIDPGSKKSINGQERLRSKYPIETISLSNDIIEKVPFTNQELYVAEVKVFPNPASDILFLDSNKIIEQARIFDIRGQIITDIQSMGESKSIDISALQNGIYFIMIKTNGEWIPQKFAKH